jgi:hypothetical protein
MQKNQTKQKKDLNEIMVKIQKPLVITMFIMAVLLIVYAFIFFTPFYDMYIMDSPLKTSAVKHFGFSLYNNDGSLLFDEAAYAYRNEKIFGLDLAYFTKFTHDIQALNHLLFRMGIATMLVSLLLFIYRAQLRKRYYVTNFVSGGIVIGFDIFAGIFLIANLVKWQGIVASQRYDIINAGKTYNELAYDSTAETWEIKEYFSKASTEWVFNLGYILCALLITIALCALAFYVVKFIYQKKHKAIDISGVKINE